MRFHEHLKKLLSEKNLKQADLCRMSGIQTSLMSDYLGGKKSPTLKNAILIADAFNISLDELVGRGAGPDPGMQLSSSTAFSELCQATKDLSESELLYILDMVKAMKQRFSKD